MHAHHRSLRVGFLVPGAMILGLTGSAGCQDEGSPQPAEVAERTSQVEQAIDQETFYPTADTYVTHTNPNASAGSDTHLVVGGTAMQRSFLKFDQAAIAAEVGSGTLVSATLVLREFGRYGTWLAPLNTIEFRRVNVAWNESATWLCPTGGTPPTCSSPWLLALPVAYQSAATQTLPPYEDANGDLSVDVTADVAAYLSGAPNHGWMIAATAELLGVATNATVEFVSRDYYYPPKLIIRTDRTSECGPLSDGNPCTTDVCSSTTGLVTHTPVAAGTSCADSTVCNGNETCNASGTCISGTPPTVDDGNPCTTDACHAVTGVSHTPVPSGTSCADGDLCNGDETCNASGSCQAGTPVDPNDNNVCTTDACNPTTGAVSHTPTPGVACPNGDLCDGDEICDAAGACQSGTPPEVDDENECTADSCDAEDGVIHTALTGTSCSDGDVCTGNETCNAQGQCVTDGALDPDDGNSCTVDACDPVLGVSHTPLSQGADCDDGDPCTAFDTCDANATCIPGDPVDADDADPKTIDRCIAGVGIVHNEASDIDGTIATTVDVSLAFLFDGPYPVQTGVAAGTIERRRAAAIQGYVELESGAPAEGAVVVVQGHPELGQTTVAADGTWIMLVNAEGALTVDIHADGFLPAHRTIDSYPQAYRAAGDVILVPLDDEVTTIDLSSNDELGVAQGSVVTDAAGTRKATLLLPAEVDAVAVMPNGDEVPLSTLSLRATEYTKGGGEVGRARMPADLPATSGFTFCIELSADEALAMGAEHVVFSEPISFFQENYYGMSVGSIVPWGFYEASRGVWVPIEDGLVIEVLDTASPSAEIDTTGDGVAESNATLDALGIDADQRDELAQLYPNGAELWFVRLPHLSPYDGNFLYTSDCDPLECDEDDPDPEAWEPFDCPSLQGGSRIECENQALGESVAIAGTSHQLTYASDRTPAFGAGRHLRLPITGPYVPPNLLGISAKVEVAGKAYTFDQDCPCDTDDFWNVTWDGKDAFERNVNGTQLAEYTLRYKYPGATTLEAARARNFGSYARIPGDQIFSYQWATSKFTLDLTNWDARAQGLGGLTLDVVHNFDVLSGTLYRGDGTQERGQSFFPVQTTLEPASSYIDHDVVALRDGSVAWTQIASLGDHYIMKRQTDGQLVQVAGPNYYSQCVNAVDRPALGACLGIIQDFAEARDGSLYIATNERILRVRADGWLELIAGTGTAGSTGDGGLASAAQVQPTAITIGSDDSVLFAETNGTHPTNYTVMARIRRIATDGYINTILGGATGYADGNDGPADLAHALNILDLATGYDGTVYFLEHSSNGADGSRVRRIDPDGTVRYMSGTLLYNPYIPTPGEGIDAATAHLVRSHSIAAEPSGGLLIVTSQRLPSNALVKTIRRIGRDNRLTTVAGFGTDTTEGGPANSVALDSQGVAVGPTGQIYIGGNIIGIIRPPVPDLGTETFLVSARGGGEAYEVDANGRHLSTIDTRLGVTLWTMSYTAGGLLDAVTDQHGLSTTIERNTMGVATAIIGPYGHRTELVINEDGWLETIKDPLDYETELAYLGPEGLLDSFTTKDGHETTFGWSDLGLLTEHTHPGGGTMLFERSDLNLGYRVQKTTPLGVSTTYDVEKQLSKTRTRTTTRPDGSVVTQDRTPAEKRTTELPDGMDATVELAADPRWGMRGAFARSTIESTPGGRTRTTTRTRSVTLSDPSNPLSMTGWTETVTVNGKTTTMTYVASTRKLTTTTPEGRISKVTYDTKGNVTKLETPDTLAIDFHYDTQGRLDTTTQGTRVSTRTYGTDGMLETLTNPESETTTLTRNNRGDVTAEERPDTEVTAFEYDGEGHTTGVTPPDQPEHAMTYNSIGELSNYNPPNLSFSGDETAYTYDLDKRLETITQPGNILISHDYDAAGRLDEVTFPDGLIARTYSNTTGHLLGIEGPYDVDLAFGYDGRLMTSVTWSGDVAGTVAWTHDNDFRIATETVNGLYSASFYYDNDSLLTGAGALTITRDPESGRVTRTTVGNVTKTFAYSTFGELESKTSRYNGTAFLELSFVRDALGRIIQKTETIDGVTTIFEYFYDDVGRLETVEADDVVVEDYEYDANGNRTVSLNSAGVFEAEHDDQDRILSYGDLEFTWSDAGELKTRTNTQTNETTTYSYDALGNLIGVELPNGDDVEYLIDGRGRRVGKRVNGVLEKQWLWRGQLQPVAELDGGGNLIARFVYAGGRNVPSLIVTPTATYEIVRDHLGSVRRVVNQNTGAVAQELEYDAWGRVLADSSPGWQPFGFAGGLFDADTGLVRFGARDYDAELGRWTAKDPFRFAQRGGPNLYAYSASDPLNRHDPTGADVGLGEEGNDAGVAKPQYFDGDDSFEAALDLNAFTQIILEGALAALGGPLGCGEPEEDRCIVATRNCRFICAGKYQGEDYNNPPAEQGDCLNCCEASASKCSAGAGESPASDPSESGRLTFPACHRAPEMLPSGFKRVNEHP